MDELIDRLVTGVGLDHQTAEKAVAIILNFLLKDGPTDKVQAMINHLPGATALLAAAGPQQESTGGTLAGLFGTGGIMGAANQLMAAGLSMGQVQSVTREVVAFSREKVGEENVGEIVGAIPGLSQFV